MRILLVNYDPDIVEALTAVLHEEGWEGRAAATVADAIASVRREPPDVVLVWQVRNDLRLTREFLAERQRDPAIASRPVILNTAFANAPERLDGVFRIVPAPFDIDVMVRAIREAVS